MPFLDCCPERSRLPSSYRYSWSVLLALGEVGGAFTGIKNGDRFDLFRTSLTRTLVPTDHTAVESRTLQMVCFRPSSRQEAYDGHSAPPAFGGPLIIGNEKDLVLIFLFYFNLILPFFQLFLLIVEVSEKNRFCYNLDMEKILMEIQKKLRAKAKPLTPQKLEWARKIVGKDFNPLGVKLAEVWKISREVYKDNRSMLNFNLALKISEQLLKSKYQEEKFAGFGFIYNFRNEFNQSILDIFKSWLEKYCTTWAFCDSFCIKVVGPWLSKNLGLIPRLEPWAKNKNLWVKRASLVAVLKNAKYLEPNYLFKRVTPFMTTKDPMLQKAAGWFLKEASQHHQDKVVKFLLKWKNKTSRLILRYACEKLPRKIKEKIL